MILLGRNANMTKITRPGVPVDPRKGITGGGDTVRWTGSCHAYIDEDITDEIKGGARLQVSQTILDLPSNIPVWPANEDVVTIVRMGPPYNYATSWPDQAPLSEDLIVRKVDGGLIMLGKLRLLVVRGQGTPP